MGCWKIRYVAIVFVHLDDLDTQPRGAKDTPVRNLDTLGVSSGAGSVVQHVVVILADFLWLESGCAGISCFHHLIEGENSDSCIFGFFLLLVVGDAVEKYDVLDILSHSVTFHASDLWQVVVGAEDGLELGLVEAVVN
jgi:hypothetical protein